MRSESTRAWLLATAACLFVSGQAFADDSHTASVDELVVTGQRAINKRAVDIRRANAQLIDSATSDEIGKLPDFNAGDAIKRLPGVSVNLYQGEPRFASIRGLNANYTTVTIDGLTMATPDSGGRQVYMEVLPSDLASRIDVMKTSSADVDAHGLGGVINFVTASAFDHPDGQIVLSARAGANLQSGAMGGKTPVGDASARYSRMFGVDQQFGAVVSANYWRRDIYIPQIFVAPTIGFFDNAGRAAPAYGGNGIGVPIARQWYNYENDRERAGASARFDWRPSDRVSGHLSSFYYWQREQSTRNDAGATQAATGLNLLQTPSTGQLTGMTQTYQRAQLDFTRKLYGLNGEVSSDLSNGVMADAKVGWSRATLSNAQQFDRYRQAGQSFNYDNSSGLPVYTPLNVANYQNLSRYTYQDRRDQLIALDQDVFDLQVSLSRNMGVDDQGFGFKAGGKWVRTTQDNLGQMTTFTGGTNTLADVASRKRLCSFACNDGGIILIDRALADGFFASQRSSLVAADNASARYGGTYGIEEDIFAGFAMAQYAVDWGRIVGGLRYERTDFTSEGFQQAGGVWGKVQSEGDYANLLPSVNVNINTGASSLLRLSYSKTIGRPRYDQQANSGGALNTGVDPYTLSTGNPDLKPLKSDNFDLGHEWYFGGGRGIFSLGAFYKEITNGIFSFGQMETMAINGVATPVYVTQARNTEHKVKLKGVEASFSYEFDFLPAPFDGLGVTGNALLSDAKFPITLGNGAVKTFDTMPQQPNRLYNLAVYYEKGPLRAKVAWNHTSRQWDDRFSYLASEATFYQNRFVEPTDYIDISASYDLAAGLSANVSVLNATSEDVIYTFGRNQEAIHDRIGFAPSVMFGLTFKH